MMTENASKREMALYWQRYLMAALALAAAGGASAAPADAVQSVPSPHGRYADWTPEDYLYRIEPGDELALRFVSNPDLNAPVTVGPDGRGVFPLISGVAVAGLTVEQANAALTEAYGTVLHHPEVEVLISSYGAAQVYVTGEVKTPGVEPIKGRLTAAQAVAVAGGLLPTARTGQVALVRLRPGGPPLVKLLSLSGRLDGADAAFPVLPGDLIFVPRSRIAEVDLFVEHYIKDVLPFSTSLSYNLGAPVY